MERSQPATQNRLPWYRHLLDIVLLVATSETINYALDHFPWPADGRLEIQGPLGMLITGLIGLIMAGLYVATGRNLWAPIIAHGLYDAGRATLFYFQGPPTAS